MLYTHIFLLNARKIITWIQLKMHTVVSYCVALVIAQPRNDLGANYRKPEQWYFIEGPQ